MKKKARVKNALWGMFISDAICMPAHWYYNRENIKKDFGNIHGYNDPPHPHPESFMLGSRYFPDLEQAKKLERPYDILHRHARFYDTPYSHSDIKRQTHDGEHGNLMPDLDKRYHYHYGLKAGDNTLGANLVRVLMRSVIKNGGYNEESFLEDFIIHMSLDGENKDPYLEIYIREWFQNYSKGFPASLCAQSQQEVWSIGSHGGIIRPLVLSMLSKSSYEGLGTAIEHQNLTHRSRSVSNTLGVLVPFFNDILNDKTPLESLNRYAKKIPLIKIHGEELTKLYHDYKGPQNIPKRKMWEIHTHYSNQYLDEFLKSAIDEQMLFKRFSTACYPEHGIPLLFYFLHKNNFDFKNSLYDNANAGGDNVHRGMILGLLSGAANEIIPESLKERLSEYEAIKYEIDKFSQLCD